MSNQNGSNSALPENLVSGLENAVKKIEDIAEKKSSDKQELTNYLDMIMKNGVLSDLLCQVGLNSKSKYYLYTNFFNYEGHRYQFSFYPEKQRIRFEIEESSGSNSSWHDTHKFKENPYDLTEFIFTNFRLGFPDFKEMFENRLTSLVNGNKKDMGTENSQLLSFDNTAPSIPERILKSLEELGNDITKERPEFIAYINEITSNGKLANMLDILKINMGQKLKVVINTPICPEGNLYFYSHYGKINFKIEKKKYIWKDEEKIYEGSDAKKIYGAIYSELGLRFHDFKERFEKELYNITKKAEANL